MDDSESELESELTTDFDFDFKDLDPSLLLKSTVSV
jgi:hypothetical protein